MTQPDVESVATHPGATDPSTVEPSTADPWTADPATVELSTADPVATDPLATDPLAVTARGRSRRAENTDFVCGHCQVLVPANTDGHYRNHCPSCLWSLHVDDKPGDRGSGCRQLMAPVGLVEKSGKGWQVVHRCTACGHHQPNRLVVDGVAPDDLDLVTGLMADQHPPRPDRGRGRRR